MKSPQRMTLPELMAATEAYQQELSQRLHQGLASLESRTHALRNFAGAFGGEMNGNGHAPLMLPSPARTKGQHGGARFKGQQVQRQHKPSLGVTQSRHFTVIAEDEKHRAGKGVVLNGTPGRARYAQPSARFLAGIPGSMYAGQKLTVNPPRYKNPKDENQTWTGHGKRPDWLVRALRSGKHTLQSMTIPGSPAPVHGRKPAGAAPRVTRLPARRGPGRPRKDAAPAANGAQGPVFQNPFKPSERWNGQSERPEWFNVARRHGYTVDELNIGGPMTSAFVKAIKGGGVYKGANALARAMSDVAASMSNHGNSVARFRNPDDESQTWTGGGTQPKWIADKIAEGHRPDEYLIPGADMPNRKDFAAFQQPAPQPDQQQQSSHN